jgi:hypothetical protein
MHDAKFGMGFQRRALSRIRPDEERIQEEEIHYAKRSFVFSKTSLL